MAKRPEPKRSRGRPTVPKEEKRAHRVQMVVNETIYETILRLSESGGVTNSDLILAYIAHVMLQDPEARSIIRKKNPKALKRLKEDYERLRHLVPDSVEASVLDHSASVKRNDPRRKRKPRRAIRARARSAAA